MFGKGYSQSRSCSSIIQRSYHYYQSCIKSIYLQSYDVPIEASDLRNMDGECNVVQDEGVDVVVPDHKRMFLREELNAKKEYSPLQHLKDSFLSCSQVTSE